MQTGDLQLERGEIAVVREYVVSRRQTLLSRRLTGQDGADFRLAKPVARHDPADLQAFRAVDRDNAVAALTIGSGLDQKRHGENHVGRTGLATALAGKFANHRVQDPLQPPPDRRIGEGQPAHPAPIEGAVGRRNLPTELGAQRRHRGPVGGGQFVGDGIGIDDADAMGGEAIGGGALAAADSPGQSDDEIAHLQFCAVGFATIPAAKSWTSTFFTNGPRAST